jgi:hypothetical protein
VTFTDKNATLSGSTTMFRLVLGKCNGFPRAPSRKVVKRCQHFTHIWRRNKIYWIFNNRSIKK